MNSPSPLLKNLAVVLHQPKFGENIGAAARSCCNMGICQLIVVRDFLPDYEDMAKMATHKAVHLIDTMEVHDRLENALTPFSIVVGTTARLGRKRTIERSPRDIIGEILPLLQNNRVALLFGPEDRGLTNDDLKFCQYVSSIPTADFSSLNLAQAVAIHCYELYATLVEQTREPASVPALATTEQLEGMYRHIENSLLAIDFLDEKSNNYWMQSIRRFLGRIRLTAKEASIIRGVCRKFLWHQNNRFRAVQTKIEEP